MVVEVLFIIVGLVILIFLWVWRGSVIQSLPEYGSYTESVVGTCVTPSGKCSEMGQQTIISYCSPNERTGWGCQDEEGRQTFATRITTQPCNSMCHSSVWEVISRDECSYPVPYNASPCVPPGVVPVSRWLKRCVPNDSSGPNSCTITVTPGFTEIGGTLPSGCVLDVTGTIATCALGVTYYEDRPCVITPELPQCGTWAIRNPVGEEWSAATFSCGYSLNPLPSAVCFDVTGTAYSSPSNLLDPGWVPLQMGCVSSINPEAEGISPTLGDGSACLPLRPPICSMRADVYATLLYNTTVKGETLVCSNPLADITGTPGCVRGCIYLAPPPPGTWIPALQELVATFWTIVTIDGGGQRFVLTANNIPCPGVGGRTTPPGLSVPSVKPLLSDCFGDPMAPLEDTTLVWLNLTRTSQNSAIGLPPDCLNEEKLRDYSGLYCVFKPVATPGDQGQLLVKILLILGKNYLGWLVRAETGYVFRQANIIGLPDRPGLTANDPSITTFLITATPGGSFSIVDAVYGYPVAFPTSDGPSKIDTGQVIFEAHPEVNGQPSLVNLDLLLNQRQTRWDPQSCNLFYSYPPPIGYPKPDIGSVI